MKRVIFIVLDSVGLTEAPDAKKFGDVGASTLGTLYRHRKSQGKVFATPNLNLLGLDDLLFRHKISTTAPATKKIGSWGTLEEISAGKDTSSGHWEFAAIPQPKAFPIFPNGFPESLLQEWCAKNNLPGVLGNKVASGTDIMTELGSEHMTSGKPIVYTSSDSVFQVAAHETAFGVERLHKICASARELLNPLNVGRVIARPFVGDNATNFSRTENRKDFSVDPDYPNLLDVLAEEKLFVYGVGKIDDIFCHRGITQTNHTGRNETSMVATLDALEQTRGKHGLIFVNLIDFDQKFGHRRDVEGYTSCVEEFDAWLPELINKLESEDLLIVSADHGNDPGFKGTDHTREIVPFFIYQKTPTLELKHLSHFVGFHHVAKWILAYLGVSNSRLPQLKTLSPLEFSND